MNHHVCTILTVLDVHVAVSLMILYLNGIPVFIVFIVFMVGHSLLIGCSTLLHSIVLHGT